MTDRAAFQASYTDWRVIKGRKVVSISFEVPIEHADLAYQVLGGMPNPASEIWCGIARISASTGSAGQPPQVAESVAAGSPDPVEEIRAPSPKRKWDDLPPQTQAAIVGAEPGFWRFALYVHNTTVLDESMAANFIREFCRVDSRAKLATNPEALTLWKVLQHQYRTWRDHPERPTSEEIR